MNSWKEELEKEIKNYRYLDTPQFNIDIADHRRIRKELNEGSGAYDITDSCDCGNKIRHNNGGNYHKQIKIRTKKEHEKIKYLVAFGTTCELVSDEYEEYPIEDVLKIIYNN